MTNDASTSELLTRIHSVPSHGSADRDMVAAEMVSAQGLEPGDLMKCSCGRLAKWSTYMADWWCPACRLRVAAPGSEPRTFIPFGI